MINSYDHIVGGKSLDYIEWLNFNQFSAWRGEKNAAFAVYGVKPPEKTPKVGETLYCEFKKSHMLFRFIRVTMATEQKNTFFGEVVPIKQITKEGEDGNIPVLET